MDNPTSTPVEEETLNLDFVFGGGTKQIGKSTELQTNSNGE